MAKQLNQDLTDEQKQILFNQGTEAPFSGKYVNHNEQGMYTCVNCGVELFSSKSKYESKEPGLAGWPSFADVAESDAVELKDDGSLGMKRVEVLCKNCGVHLGHLFEGASDHPSGVHYCINSACLGFKPSDKKKAMKHKQVEEYILTMPNARLDYPFGEEAAVYKIKDKMFAIIMEGKEPVRLSLKCDPLLAETLRQKYDTVMPGYHLNKKHWNTIVLTGQLSDQEVKDLIRHSYELVAA